MGGFYQTTSKSLTYLKLAQERLRERFSVDEYEPLKNAPRVIFGNWLIESVAYDRQRLILELEMNTGEKYQHFAVPRRAAIGLVQANEPAKYWEEFIQRTYRFERVRVRR